MNNPILKTLLQVMSNNHPSILGDDYYVSISEDREDHFAVTIFHEERYKQFFTVGLILDCMAYAQSFYLNMAFVVRHGLPVITLTWYKH